MAGKSRQNDQDGVIVESLAKGQSQTAAAMLAGCSVSTVRRRLEDPKFSERVDQFRKSMLDTASGQLSSLLTKAAATLEALLAPKIPPAVRLAAARSIFELAIRSRDVLEIEKRIATLEADTRTDEEEE